MPKANKACSRRGMELKGMNLVVVLWQITFIFFIIGFDWLKRKDKPIGINRIG